MSATPKSGRTIIFVIATVCAAITLGSSLAFLGPGGLAGPPQWASDDADYENIGFNLATKGQYVYDWSDPAWRQRYLAYNSEGTFDALLQRSGSSPTTYRAPVLPLIIAVLYKIFGLSFLSVRLFNLAVTAITIFIAVVYAGSVTGTYGAMIAALFLILNPHFAVFGGMVMTESIGAFFAIITFIAIAEILRRAQGNLSGRHLVLTSVAGTSLGLLMLARSLYLLWIPPILVTVGIFAFFSKRRKSLRSLLWRFISILSIAIVLQLPWWIHNIIVLRHFAPLGALGAISLSGAYSDGSYALNGIWSYSDYLKVNSESMDIYRLQPEPRDLFEYVWMTHAKESVLKWTTENVHLLPQMFIWRILSNYYLDYYTIPYYGVSLSSLLALAVIAGAIAWLRRPIGWLFSLAVVLDAMVIGVTYNGHGRYITVLLPIFSIAAAGLVFLPSFFRQRMAASGTSDFPSTQSFRSILRVDRKQISVFLITLVSMGAFSGLALRRFALEHSSPHGLNVPPEHASDDADYDHLAFNLSTVNEYAYIWENQSWSSRYTPFNADGRYNELLSRKGASPTTFHAPLYPFLLSVLYRAFGPSFAVARIFSLLCMTLAVGAAVLFSGSLLGPLGAFVTTLVVIFGYPYMISFSTMLMSEALATLLLTLACISFFLLMRSSQRKPAQPFLIQAILAGALAALTVMTRTIYIFWMPFVVVYALIAMYFSHNAVRAASFRRWFVFFLICVTFQAPWWIRNSLTTGHLTPLGVQGGAALIGAYSDESVLAGGEWQEGPFLREWFEFSRTFQGKIEKPIDYEYYRSREMGAKAMNWIKSHPEDLPQLFLGRIIRHYTDIPPYFRPYGLITLLFVLTGALCLLALDAGWIFLAIIVVDALVVGFLFENEGRFLIPLIPILSVAAGGIVRLPDLFAPYDSMHDPQNRRVDRKIT